MAVNKDTGDINFYYSGRKLDSKVYNPHIHFIGQRTMLKDGQWYRIIHITEYYVLDLSQYELVAEVEKL